MNRAAFFDIDGTIFRNSLLVEHFKKLVKNNDIDYDYRVKDVKPIYDEYDHRFGEYDEYLLAVTKIYQNKLVGIDKDYINSLADKVIIENKDVVYRIARNELKRLKSDGYYIFFISGSPDFLVDKFGKYYHADESIGTNYVFDKNGKFTGKVKPMWDSENKKKSLNYLVKKYDIDLKNSFAFGDTNGDFSMISSVGNPVAINPSFEFLENISSNDNLRNKIKIYIERKDVLYSFDLINESMKFKKF
ncbi:MAG: HAD-IB family hydrolase [Peptoniphilaceae bacterium]|nr:HAD-IB family hydrolase [Peptoniphilaceae bacterium]MDD7383441.1 HAD-IB family hydrolase [Peptoniphilaceae bacterium]MDY3738495.1 HAD-IB family hydrolase [Peptoniphilaceae bacterium]